MRVWDVNPGYLNRQSLLGEHREIHAILSIVTHGKKGYARHPETLRWKHNLEALKHRHDLVVSEMTLRGYQHHSPVAARGTPSWPSEFVDPPARQFAILEKKYLDREPGRIPLPRTPRVLWAQHEHSLLARGPAHGLAHHSPGKPELARPKGISFEQLALELTEVLRGRPPERHLMDALCRMWERVSQFARSTDPHVQDNPVVLIDAIRELSLKHNVVPLRESTALSDLHAWISAPLAGWETAKQG